MQPGRLAIALVVAPLVVLLLGVRAGLSWSIALFACEAATWVATGPFVRGARIGRAHRLIYLATSIALNLTWVALSLLFWFDPAPDTPFTALLIWACLLIGGVSFAFRSPLALVIFAGPVSLAMIATPLFAPRFEGAQQMIAVAGTLACTSYGWIMARRNLASARALERASADLAEQKHAAEAANRAKSAFLAMMSHEIRTPMNGVLGMAHALEATKLDARQHDYVDTLIRSGDGLMAILDDVLDVARIEAGRLDIADEAFDLRDVVQKAQGLWRQTAADKGLAMVCEIAADAPTWVRGDAVRVRQILLNLLSNAIKFTEAGEVRVVLEAAPDGVVLAVSDTGVGMDQATVAALFQRFTQGDAGRQRRYGGVGLGLAISQDLAGLMGGVIEVETARGAGSTFRLKLPLSAVEAGVVLAAPETPQPSPLEVLVVDDNAANRAVAVALVEALGASVRTVADGEAALAALAQRPVDVVLMDIHMPGMDGVETAARIRAGEAGDATTPIVALTADAMTGARERLLAQGFDDYLTKPISPVLLAQALARVEPRT